MLLIRQLPILCKTGKKFSIYRRYVRNSGQRDFNQFADYTYAKMMIVSTICMDLLVCHYNIVVQPAGRSSEQFFCYKNISFGYLFPINYKGLAYLSNKIVQNKWVIM